MPLHEALSRCPSATLVEADETYYHGLFDEIVEALLQKSPLVESSELGCAYVGVNGLEAMYGGEPRVVTALLNAVPGGFGPRIGLAKSKFPAYIAAVKSGDGEATKVPDDVRGFLQRFSIDLLPLSWKNRARLHRFGLHTMGQLADMSVGSLQSQFGVEGRVAWDLANGIDDSPLIPIKYRELVIKFLEFPVPAASLFAILPAVDTLIGRVFSDPRIRGKYLRSLSLQASIFNRPSWSKKVAFKTPVNKKERVLFVLKGVLEGSNLPGPLEDIRITVTETAGESGRQLGLFTDVRKKEQLQESMRQLQTRLRTSPPLYKVMDVEPWSRIPERRQALVQFAP